MKVGILGTGFGIVHVEVFSQHPLVDEVLVYSRKQENLDRILSEHTVQGTTNMDDILTDPSVDVVTIALPPQLHAEIAIKAMENGKDVICEIPVCTTLEDAEKIAAAARRTGKRVLVDLFDRFTAPAKAIHRIIQSGEYGNLCDIQLHNAAGPVWGSHPLPLAVLPMEMSYSDFDFLYWCLGELNINAVNAIQRDGASSAITVLLDGMEKHNILLTNSALPPKSYASQSHWELCFDLATISYHERSWAEDGNNRADLMLYTESDVQPITLEETNHYFDALDYSLCRISDGVAGITDLEQAIPALKLVLDLELKISQSL